MDEATLHKYVADMNAERLRCGSPPFYVDDRLQSVAKDRLDQLPACRFSHFFPGMKDPRPALLKKYNFPDEPLVQIDGEWLGSCSEGLTIDDYDPPGLVIPSEQYPHEPSWKAGRFTHHNDLVNPWWTYVGYAYGVTGGRKAAVVIYGREKSLTGL